MDISAQGAIDDIFSEELEEQEETTHSSSGHQQLDPGTFALYSTIAGIIALGNSYGKRYNAFKACNAPTFRNTLLNVTYPDAFSHLLSNMDIVQKEVEKKEAQSKKNLSTTARFGLKSQTIDHAYFSHQIQAAQIAQALHSNIQTSQRKQALYGTIDHLQLDSLSIKQLISKYKIWKKSSHQGHSEPFESFLIREAIASKETQQRIKFEKKERDELEKNLKKVLSHSKEKTIELKKQLIDHTTSLIDESLDIQSPLLSQEKLAQRIQRIRRGELLQKQESSIKPSNINENKLEQYSPNDDIPYPSLIQETESPAENINIHNAIPKNIENSLLSNIKNLNTLNQNRSTSQIAPSISIQPLRFMTMPKVPTPTSMPLPLSLPSSITSKASTWIADGLASIAPKAISSSLLQSAAGLASGGIGTAISIARQIGQMAFGVDILEVGVKIVIGVFLFIIIVPTLFAISSFTGVQKVQTANIISTVVLSWEEVTHRLQNKKMSLVNTKKITWNDIDKQISAEEIKKISQMY